jgi:hypothetical protein
MMLTVPQLVKKFSPTFCVTQRFIIAFRSPRHLYLRSSRLILSIPPCLTCFKSILIISQSVPRSFKWSVSLRSPHGTPVCISPLYRNATCPTYLIRLDFFTRIIFVEEYKSESSSFYNQKMCINYLVRAQLYFHNRIIHWVYSYMFRSCVLAIVRLYYNLTSNCTICALGTLGERDLVLQ